MYLCIGQGEGVPTPVYLCTGQWEGVLAPVYLCTGELAESPPANPRFFLEGAIRGSSWKGPTSPGDATGF